MTVITTHALPIINITLDVFDIMLIETFYLAFILQSSHPHFPSPNFLPLISMTTQSPAQISFEEAINQSQTLLEQVADGQISDADLTAQITDLVQTENGARGFFVIYLTADLPLADHPSQGLVKALQSSPDVVSELLVKNLAMSSATAISHGRNQDQEMAEGSKQVSRRTIALIQMTNLPETRAKLQRLKSTIQTGQGEYQAFLERWGYDAEQKQVILAAIAACSGLNQD
jgi:hypothetical protein